MEIVNSSNSIFVNPREPRGKALLRNRGEGQPWLKRIWAASAKELDPEIVIDVGANYGEILFFATYPPKTRIIGIEANQDLQVYLERSQAVHPNHDQIELVCAVASNQYSESTRFSVPTRWSGSGTARALPNEEGIVIQTVRSITLDSLFAPSETEAAALLFKIDVEGHEPLVFEGMLNLLDSCELALGIVEFNPNFLGECGMSSSSCQEVCK